MPKIFNDFISDYTYLSGLVGSVYKNEADYKNNFLKARISPENNNVQIVSPFLTMVAGFFSGIEQHRSKYSDDPFLMQVTDALLQNDKPLFEKFVGEFVRFVEQQNHLIHQLGEQLKGREDIEPSDLLTAIENCLYDALEKDIDVPAPPSIGRA